MHALHAALGAVLADAADDLAKWNGPLATGDPTASNDRLRWLFDGHVRVFDDFGGFGQSIVRPAIGWALEGGGTAWAGWAWVRTAPAVGEAIDEQRFFQQWTGSTRVGRYGCAARARLEERLAEGGDDTAVRFRQLLRVERAVRDRPSLTLVAWDELFVNLDDADWGPLAGLDQNRVFLGFGIRRKPNAEWRTEIGYLNQALNTPGPANRVNHMLSVNFIR